MPTASESNITFQPQQEQKQTKMHCVRASIYGSMFFVHLTIVKLYNCYFNYHPITHLEFDFTLGWVFLKYFLILCMLNWLQKHNFCGTLIGQMLILNLKSHFKWKQDHIFYTYQNQNTHTRKQYCMRTVSPTPTLINLWTNALFMVV